MSPLLYPHPPPPNNTYPPTYYILFIALQRAWANKYKLLLFNKLLLLYIIIQYKLLLIYMEKILEFLLSMG